jgi:hypothetical protein
MLPMNDALAGQYGTRPRQHLADGGFAKLDDIEALAQNGVETFVPVPKPRNADRDRHAPQPSDPPGECNARGFNRTHRRARHAQGRAFQKPNERVSGRPGNARTRSTRLRVGMHSTSGNQ